MLTVCQMCGGSGVVITMAKGLTLPKNTSQKDLLKAAHKEVCKMCGGSGEIQSGWLARQLGLKPKTINEG